MSCSDKIYFLYSQISNCPNGWIYFTMHISQQESETILSHVRKVQLKVQKNRDFFMGSADAYGIYARVNLFSQNVRASATSE